jgi:8-oxo-dGTP pyrophosphatase MutT (NUDIX family)
MNDDDDDRFEWNEGDIEILSQAADEDKDESKYAAGIMFVTDDGKVLLLKRHKHAAEYPNMWGLPGGHSEPGESMSDTAVRETHEEINRVVDPAHLFRVDNTDNDGINFTTYLCEITQPFKPDLNHEHVDYEWLNIKDDLPSNIIPPLAKTLTCLKHGNLKEM